MDGSSTFGKVAIKVLHWEPSKVSLFNSTIRVLLEVYVDVLIVIMIAVVPNHYGTGSFISGVGAYTTHDKWTWVYLAVLWIVIPGFLVYVIWLGARLFRRVADNELRHFEVRNVDKLLCAYGDSNEEFLKVFEGTSTEYEKAGCCQKRQKVGAHQFKAFCQLRHLAEFEEHVEERKERIEQLKLLLLKSGEQVDTLTEKEKDLVEKSAPFLEDYKQYSYAALMFNHQFLVRRTLLVFSCFFLNAVPQIQALVYIYLSLGVLGYLVYYLPFADRA